MSNDPFQPTKQEWRKVWEKGEARPTPQDCIMLAANMKVAYEAGDWDAMRQHANDLVINAGYLFNEAERMLKAWRN